ncbi:MAG TPA: hypothetical protein VF139_01710 [Candidatus Polarisedimenticolaceae bacterium]
MRWALALNATIVLCSVAAPVEGVPGPLRMLAAGLLVLVLPGLGWLGAFRRIVLDPTRLALATVGISAASSVLGFVLLVGTARPPSPGGLLLWTLLVANAGLWSVRGPGRFDDRARWRDLAIVAGAAFSIFSLAALHLVPPLEDHDMEVRGTAWGLATELKPYFQTNREVYLPLAHPVLLHGFVAQSLAWTGEIETTRGSYEAAKRAEAARGSGAPFDGMAAWRADYEAMVRRPALAGTRAPGVLLAALAAALLFDLVARLGASVPAAWGAVACWLTFPETIVRSSYAGYFAPAVFAMAVAAGSFGPRDEDDARRPIRQYGPAAAAGFLCAWLDHKTIVFAGAVTAWFAWRFVATRRLDLRAAGLFAGFSAGTLAWWAYGLSVDVHAFVQDHLRMHFAHRLLLDDLRLFPGGQRYSPSMLELWGQFSSHTGWLFLPVAIVAAFLWLRPRGDDGDARRTVLAVWALGHLIAFTLTDWRQTKHLMNGLLPLVAAAFVAISETRHVAVRRAAVGALVLAFLWNVATDVRLFRDFGSLVILGASDVDGW